MKLRFLYMIILYTTLLFGLYSQIKVEIGMPTLNDGMEQLEVLLYTNIGSAVSDLELVATDALLKPELTNAFSNSVGITRPISIINNLSNIHKYSFSIGSSLGLYSQTFEYNDLEDEFSNLEPEDDIEFGINPQLINTTFTIPHFLFSFSYLDLEAEEYFMSATTGALAYGIIPIKKIRLSSILNWIPASFQAGYSYGFTKIGINVETGIVAEEFSFDIDNDGPLPEQSVNIEIEPIIKVGLDSYIGTASFIGATGVSLLDFLRLNMGGGVNFSHGNTNISVNSSSEIKVLGFLSGLIEEPGTVSISGSVKGSEPDNFIGYLFSSVQFNISTMFFNIGILYNVPKGFSAGFSCGLYY